MSYRIVKRPKIAKDLHAELFGYARPSGIKRTRKRAIEQAKFINKAGYQYSQYWLKAYGKFRKH